MLKEYYIRMQTFLKNCGKYPYASYAFLQKNLSSDKNLFFLSLNWCARDVDYTPLQTNKFTVLGVVLFQPCAK